MNWLHCNKDYEFIPLDDNFDTSVYFGFIYKITNLNTGKSYIGKKAFFHNKKKKLTKKELAEQPVARGRKLTTKIEQVDSGWRNYWGSSKELLSDIKILGEDKFQRLILEFCNTKKQLTYYEIYHQMLENVLFIDSYNDNILGKFYRKDFASPK